MIATAASLAEFHKYAVEQVAAGREALLEDLLAEWQSNELPPETEEDAVAAIQRGLDDVAAGRTRPADEVMAEICERYGMTWK